MTITKPTRPNWAIALGIPLLISLCCYLITFSPKFAAENELLSTGILADLLVTAPLVYLLAIRKSDVSKLTVIRVFIIELLFASIILHAHSGVVLKFIKTWISPMIELYVVSVVCRKFYVANKKAKASDTDRIDFLLHCRSVVFDVFGNRKIANVISSEVAVIYYALFGKKEKCIDYKTRFTSYKENGLLLILGVVLFVFLIETSGVHFLLSIWNSTVAWIITGVSLYTCLQLFAHIRAIKARPVIIRKDSFEVHHGLAGDAFFEFQNIEKIELSNKKPGGRQAVKISLLSGLENHNVVVYLKTPIEVTKVFGIKRSSDTVLFFVDRPKEFLDVVTNLMEHCNK